VSWQTALYCWGCHMLHEISFKIANIYSISVQNRASELLVFDQSCFHSNFYRRPHRGKLFRESICVFSFTLYPLSCIILDGTNKHLMLYFRLWMYTLRLTRLVESVVIIMLKWPVITSSAWLYMNVELAGGLDFKTSI
jgi:hypothetical protein